MNINRDNYEAYFLLYTDNELSVADKNMVDAFIAANTDLGEELVMLQQSILKPDAVVFIDKEKLLKAETIDAATEEKLLLLLDDELKGKEKEHFFALIQNNKTLQQEWLLLQQTKLTAANVAFQDKDSLYKKEDYKVVPIRWWRMAAAAMLIGFGLWGTVGYLNKGNTADTIVETLHINTPPAADTSTTPSLVKQENAVDGKINTATNDAAKAVDAKKTQRTINTSPDNIHHAVLPKQIDNKNIAITPQRLEIIPAPVVGDNINKEQSNKNDIANVEPETVTNNIESTNESPVTPANSFASNASLPESKTYNTFDDDDEERPKRTKVGGFFKRVKRVLERKTNIKTGNGDDVRIANMSFAMH